MTNSQSNEDTESNGNASSKPYLFWTLVSGPAAVYAAFIVGLLLADLFFLSPGDLLTVFQSPQHQHAFQLSLATSLLSTIIAVFIAVPTAYVLSRWNAYAENDSNGRNFFHGRGLRWLVDSLFDIPIVLPPLVVGISLLVFFQSPVGKQLEMGFASVSQLVGGPQGITFEVPAIILAQSTVVTAFAIRMMRQVIDSLPQRIEQVARTLGASRWQTFCAVVFPQLKSGIKATATLAFAKSLGEFGPILVFAGMTPLKTEIAPTSIYLAFQKGELSSAVALSLAMIMISMGILLLMCWSGASIDSTRQTRTR